MKDQVRPRLRRVLAALLALAGTLALAACGGDDEQATGSGQAAEPADLEIAYSLYTREAPYFQGNVKGVEDEADRQGIELQTLVSGLDPERQIQQLETAITQQPDAIILTAIDAAGVIPTVEKAEQAGIPVFALGEDIALGPGEGKVQYVGADYVNIGERKAMAIAEAIDGEGTVGRVYGVRGTNFDNQQRAGEESVWPQFPGIDVVKGPYAGNYTVDAGLEATQNLLTGTPELDALFCDNADIALGCVQAVKEAGKRPGDDVFIVSEDGISEELDAVRNGEINFTVALCSYDEGTEVVKQVVDMLVNGKEVPAGIIDEGREFTPETIPDDAGPTTEPCPNPPLRVEQDYENPVLTSAE